MKKFFHFEALKTNYKKETLGALSTFSAMAYIIIVHPTIMQQATLPFGPMMTVTILITAFATLLMGLYPKIPLACAPAMGVSAYFAFTLIQKNQIPANQALMIVFLAALTIFLMNVFQIRRKILNAIPDEMINGITGGIGLFLIAVGLKQLGILKVNSFGVVNFHQVDTGIYIIFFIGLGLIYFFEKLKIEAAFILSIFITWAVSIILGFAKLKGIVALPPNPSSLFFYLSFPEVISLKYFKAFLSIFLVTLFDSSAGLITMKKALPIEARSFSMQKALYPDAIGSLFGSLMGTSSLAIHLESLAGIHSGAKSGFAACLISLLFLSCLFFYPLASSIPQVASAPVIVAIGILMAKQLKPLFALHPLKMIAPFAFAIVMPLTLSLYQGFRFGFIIEAFLSLAFPKKVPRSKVVIIFGGLFLIEGIFEYFLKY
jgi:AGZA family xanthine/uracil permease-like MFS transporter